MKRYLGRSFAGLLVVGLLALAGCGNDDGDDPETKVTPGETTVKETDAAPARMSGTQVTAGESDFGRILFDSKQQAIYIFERDGKNKSNCYGECAVAWPPVLTEGEPEAGRGIDRSLLATTERRDGKLQVTYAGKPLYYYAHEGPREVKCHNVNLNGGFWWVIGPDGTRRQ
jgi:predicted lipoprotein with Yx(FWY)xxD motif